jgi:hypothetical protein
MRPSVITFRIAAALAVAGLLGACATSPRLDRQFGDRLRQVKAQQTLDPQAGRNTAPVNGMDAPAAKSAYDSYQRSFATPDQQNSGFTIGSGGVTSR